MSDPRISYATLNDGSVVFDEFVAENATVHIEAMNRVSWWIGIDLPDGRSWHTNLGAVNQQAKPFAICEQVAP